MECIMLVVCAICRQTPSQRASTLLNPVVLCAHLFLLPQVASLTTRSLTTATRLPALRSAACGGGLVRLRAWTAGSVHAAHMLWDTHCLASPGERSSLRTDGSAGACQVVVPCVPPQRRSHAAGSAIDNHRLGRHTTCSAAVHAHHLLKGRPSMCVSMCAIRAPVTHLPLQGCLR